MPADDESTEADPPGSDGSAAQSGDDSAGSAGEAPDDPVEARLADALERVAHGATVSVPAIMLERALMVAFTALLTNGFAAEAYGLFAIARRLQRYLASLALGFRSGLSRFLPNTDTPTGRDVIVTVAGILLLGVATVFGIVLYAAAPLVTAVTSEGAQFRAILEIFALGLPASVALFAVGEVLRGLEEVGPMNLTLRVGFPTAQLLVAAAGVVLFDDILLVATGVVLSMGGVAVLAALWLARERGLRPRLRAPELERPWRRYLAFTIPLFLGGFATTTQRLGFYPLIALFLSGVAGGVFAVGVLVGAIVRLPLIGINQFTPPVAAALHEEDHREALRRFYHVTSRLVLVGTTALATPAIVYREAVMGLFGPTFVQYAPLLPAFVVAQYGACAAGSVGILLTMTDNQRALLVTNVLVTGILVVTAVPLTIAYGLPGLVASYLLMLTLNNGLEVVVLYYLEGLQPFTRLHARPLVAAVPLVAVALAAKHLLAGPAAPLVGTALGLAAYALAMRTLGFTPVERRLGATLVGRYRAAAPDGLAR